jgi:hypothetical protein
MSAQKMLKVSIHQPETYPQLGYFNKIYHSDLFVFLDCVNYRKNYFQNRNRIRGKQGDVWLTLPVSGGGRINEKTYERNAIIKHIKSIRIVYGAGSMQSNLSEIIFECDQASKGSLSEFNISFIKSIAKLLGQKLNYIKSSEFNIVNRKSALLLDLCKKTSANIYLSGPSGQSYLDHYSFAKDNIQVWVQNFDYPIYTQKSHEFNKYVSIIDTLCTSGLEKTKAWIQTENWERL